MNKEVDVSNQAVDEQYDERSRRDRYDDEINLFDLVQDLNLQKRWFFLSLTTVVAIALVYILTATPIYSVNSVVKPVTEKRLAELNVPQLEEIFSMTVEEAFEHGKQALLSKEYRIDYMRSRKDDLVAVELYDEALSDGQNFARLDKLVSTKLSNEKKDAESFVSINFEMKDPEFAADFLNGYVEFALTQRLEEIKDTLTIKREARLNKLSYDAGLIREQYYTQKIRRSLELSEALRIAKAVGQAEPVYSKSDILGSFKPPLYMYGAKALEAEESALNSRDKIAKNYPLGEEHFIQGLPEILFEMQQLKSLEIDYSKVSVASIDERALVPERPIKPKKALILALAIVAGGFMGLMVALVVASYRRYLENKAKKKA